MNTEKRLLQDAAREIKQIRRENETLRARLSGFEDALLLLKTAPNFGGQGLISPDIVYDLEKRIAQIENEREEEKAVR